MLVKVEGPKSPKVFVTLARAYEEICYIHCDGASLISFNPVHQLGIVILLLFSWHHTAHHIPQIPRKSPEPDVGEQDLLSQ